MSGRTVIVGGGLAGLAAAAALADRGVPVTLIESRPRLGGRASSFVDHATGERIDNCQHVVLGCCTNFRHFCETVGLDDLFRDEPVLYFIARDGAVNRLAAGRLPAPLHLFPAFRRLSYLAREDVRALSRGVRALARTDPAAWSGRSFADWLREHDQTPACINRFWNVVLVSALSESTDRIGVAHARKVFVDAFLANARGWRMSLPVVPLDDLYGQRLRGWLERRGADVRLQQGADCVIVDEGRARGVRLRGGEILNAHHVVAAVPHHLALSLLPEALRDHPELRRVAELQSAPITSVHLWFDRPITSLPHAVLVDRLSQWMFNRSAIRGETPSAEAKPSEAASASPAESGSYYYQVIVSASHALQGRPQDEVLADVARELQEVWPAARTAKLRHARVVTEHRAVFSPAPGSDDCRPAQQSPVANLQLAGDWTRTGWPATMEGAVRSGYLAAQNILAQLGRPETLLQRDLAVAPLSKWLLGL